MNILDSTSVSKLIGSKYRPIIICTMEGCRKAIVEGPEMTVEQLNANWLSLMTSAPTLSCQEAKPCACVEGCKIKHSISIVIIDVKTAKGVPAADLLSAQNISMTKFRP